MATQIGSNLLSGGLDNLVFYMLNGKPVARRNGSASGRKIKRDPRYARFRENGREFGQSVKAAGELFYGLGSLRHYADNQLRQRLNKVFTRITSCDTTGTRGERKAIPGLQSNDGKRELTGFEINDRLKLRDLLNTRSGIVSCRGQVLIRDFHYDRVNVPEGATHVMLQACWLSLDLAAKHRWLVQSEPQFYNREMETSDVVLKSAEVIKEMPFLITLLKVSFWTGEQNEMLEMADAGAAIGIVGALSA